MLNPIIALAAVLALAFGLPLLSGSMHATDAVIGQESARMLASSAAGDPSPAAATGDATDRCPPYPSFPDANCTGPTSQALPIYSGPLDFREDGQIIENTEMRIDRGLYVAAKNVTFRNVRIVYTGARNADFTMVNLNYNSGTVFENCELDGQDRVARAISGSGVTVRNCEIHHVGNAIETETPLVVEGNYIHDIHSPEGTDWHADGIQTPMGYDNVIVRHNTIILTGPETGAINIMGSAENPAENVQIENNLFAGGGFTLYAGPGRNYFVVDNHLSTQIFPKVGFYGIWYWASDQDGDVTRSGNVIHETGAKANTNNFAGTSLQ